MRFNLVLSSFNFGFRHHRSTRGPLLHLLSICVLSLPKNFITIIIIIITHCTVVQCMLLRAIQHLRYCPSLHYSTRRSPAQSQLRHCTDSTPPRVPTTPTPNPQHGEQSNQRTGREFKHKAQHTRTRHPQNTSNPTTA